MLASNLLRNSRSETHRDDEGVSRDRAGHPFSLGFIIAIDFLCLRKRAPPSSPFF